MTTEIRSHTIANNRSHGQTNLELDRRKLAEMIRDIGFAMLTTVDPDGHIRSRPMATQEFEFDGDLWFFTGRSTGKVHSIENDQRVGLSYASPEASLYVSIFGRAEIIDDSEKAKELWKPIFETWFPKGLEDPELVLIKVHVEGADLWDGRH